MTTVFTRRYAGEPCERCGGQMFWEIVDDHHLPRDYCALVCLQCGIVGEERWRESDLPVIERARRGRPPKRRPA